MSTRQPATGDEVIVVVPTFNERDNVPRLVGHLLALPVAGLRVLIVDDGSPDGTGKIADRLAHDTGGLVEVLHREAKDGLGKAYVAGMQRALLSEASVVVQMDADLSHPYEAIPVMVGLLADPRYDVIVGSRYVEGGSVSDAWPWRRRALSRTANRYVNGVLSLGIQDATSGFKAWRSDALRAIDLSSIRSSGYGFQIEMGHACRRLGLNVAEVPIHFEDRDTGTSKMTLAVQWEAARLPWQLRRRSSRSRIQRLDPDAAVV